MSGDKRVIYLPQSGLTWVGREGANLDAHPYLFITRRGHDVFIEIMQKLHELNDFCVILYDGIKEKTDSLPSIAKELNDAKDEEAQDLVYHKWCFGYKAEDLGKIFCPASSLVMLYAALIEGLTNIARYFGEEEFKAWTLSKDPKINEFRQLAELLRSISGHPLPIFDDRRISKNIEERVRRIRNDFMHAKWQKIEENLIELPAKECFKLVSMIMASLEEVFHDDDEPWASNPKYQKKIIF